jgi:ketosteroid isomerase-like protein
MLGELRFRTLLTLLLGLLLLSAAPVRAQSRDARAVRALIDRLIQASNSVDPAVVRQALGEFSTTAGPLFPPFGDPPASVSDLGARVEQTLAGLAARTLVTTTPVTVDADRRSAWSAFSWRAEYTFKDGTRRAFDGRATLIFAKEGRTWKLKHWHSSLPATVPPTAAAVSAEEEKILTIERAIWEAHRNRDLIPVQRYFADDVSLFEDGQAYRVQGKREVLNNFESWLARSELQHYQLLDPKVVVAGDSALLTYYFTESGLRDGRAFQATGKATTVYVRRDGTWQALHAHFSVNPQPQAGDQGRAQQPR